MPGYVVLLPRRVFWFRDGLDAHHARPMPLQHKEARLLEVHNESVRDTAMLSLYNEQDNTII